MRIAFLFVFFTQIGLTAPTRDIAWIDLQAEFSYRDPLASCSASIGLRTLEFSAEVEGGLVKRAVIHDGRYWLDRKFLELTQEEAERITTYTDHYGTLWMERLVLSPRVATWIANRLIQTSCGAIPKVKTIRSESTSSLEYLFKTEGLGETTVVGESTPLSLAGEREDEKPYTLELNFYELQILSRR